MLCLPDEAAREAVALADELGNRRAEGAGCQHRASRRAGLGLRLCRDGRRARPSASPRRAGSPIPAAIRTGGIALLRPLVDAGLLPPDYPVTINAVSGYSGGGRAMIEAHERDRRPGLRALRLGLEHKHVPEIAHYCGLARRPIFVPSVGHFRQGMLVSVPLHLDTLPGRPSGADLHAALAARLRRRRAGARAAAGADGTSWSRRR